MLEKINKERLNFVRYWANYVKKNDPLIWSKQQKILINSVLKNANQNPELYLKVKRIAKKVHESLQRRKI